MSTLDYYYTVISAFAYLGELEMRRIADSAGVTVRYRPVDIAALFAAVDTVPPARQSPAKRAWRDSEVIRWGALRKLPVKTTPRYWPVPSAKPSCAVIAAQELGLDPGPLSQALLAGVWSEDLNISEDETVNSITHRVFPDDAERILAAANEAEVAKIFDENTQEAIAKGVFGSPTYFHGGEMLFGQDRLPFLAARLGVQA